MLKLDRMEHIREEVELPSGEVLKIDCNVELLLPDLLKAWADIAAIAESMKHSNDYSRRGEFYAAYTKLIRMVVGSENYTKIVGDYNGDMGEVAELFSPWVMDVVMPAITRASKRNLEREKRRSRR